MSIKIFDIQLDNWQKQNDNEYVRNRDGKLYAPISIIKIYSRKNLLYAWYPNFSDQLEFIQQIYDESTDFKEFHYNNVEEGMEFIDDFLKRLDKIKSFC